MGFLCDALTAASIQCYDTIAPGQASAVILSTYIDEGRLEVEKKPLQASREHTYVSSELAAAKLDVALESEDIKAFMTELGQIIKARGGYTTAARAAAVNRSALYKIVSAEGNPKITTLVALLRPLGLRLSIKPIAEEDAQDSSGLHFKAEAP